MSEDLTQLHLKLKGEGSTGRGVRLRRLSPSAKEQASIDAAKATKDGTEGEFIYARNRECLYRMIAEVTAERDLKDADACVTAKWVKVSQQDLQMPGKYQLGNPDFLGAKDIDVLVQFVRQNYDTSTAEAEEIMGKALRVSSS